MVVVSHVGCHGGGKGVPPAHHGPAGRPKLTLLLPRGRTQERLRHLLLLLLLLWRAGHGAGGTATKRVAGTPGCTLVAGKRVASRRMVP